MPVTFTYSKIIREVLKSDGSSLSPFKFVWAVRNVTTGRTALYENPPGTIVVAKGEVSNAVKATAEAGANSAADTALTFAQTQQKEGQASYDYLVGQPALDAV
jgi:hypothetical protein